MTLTAFLGVTGTSRDAFAGKKQLIPQGNGQYSVEVKANFYPESLSDLQVTSTHAEDYCDLFRETSRRIWQLTNGQHYFENVTFGYGGTEADVFIIEGPRSVANGNRVLLQLTSSPPDPGYVGELAHEWGHYFYDLPDEYLETAYGKFEMGYCTDSLTPELCTTFPTPSCGPGASCVRPNSCVNIGGDYDGYIVDPVTQVPFDVGIVETWGVVTTAQCTGAGGAVPPNVCVLNDANGTVTHNYLNDDPTTWEHWGKACTTDAQCHKHANEGKCTYVMWPPSGTGSQQELVCSSGPSCIMGDSANGQDEWCTHTSHVHFTSEGLSLSHQGSLINKAAALFPNGAEDWSCWDYAQSIWGGLQVPANDQYNPNLGNPPNDGDPNFCTWNVPDYTEVEDLLEWSMIVIDASGSMGADANGTPGWKYAADGASFFNQVAVDNQTKAGVYAFGDELWPVQWADVVNNAVQTPNPGQHEMVLGDPVDLSPSTVALYEEGIGDYVGEVHYTNLCSVLEGAKEAFDTAEAPQGDREVVLMTDAIFTRHAAVASAECRGIDMWVVEQPDLAGQICDEAGMIVNVISTGALVNVDLADWLALECGGKHFYAGDEQALGGSFPHSAKVYAAMAKFVVAGQQISLHERAPLEVATSTQSYSFPVPAGTSTIDVSWFGSPALDVAGSPTAAFELLDFELESPSQVVYNPTGDAAEVNGIYRRISIATPEAGVWTMRLDKSQLSGFLRAQVNMGWLVALDHPDYHASAWVDRPVWTVGEEVTIRGVVQRHDNGMGGMLVSARISGDGQSWEVDMFDDGLHGDEHADDGVYGAHFIPTDDAPYSVKVYSEVIANTSYTIPGESLFGSGPGRTVLTEDVSLIAYASFEARTPTVGEVRATLPDLQTGYTHHNLTATIEGLFVPTKGTLVSLGEGVVVNDLEIVCTNCQGQVDVPPEDTQYELRFSVDVADDAPLTQRDLLVEIGGADYIDEDVTTVVQGNPALDTDGDATPDATDTDDDGDGLPDSEEVYTDSDADGVIAMLDADSDGDGDADGADIDPLNPSTVHQVAYGDFDGDTVLDLARGVPTANSAEGLVQVTDGASETTVSWNRSSIGILDSAVAGDRFGEAIAIGNFNGDSYDDIAVAVPDDDVSVLTDAGSVHIIYGSASGLTDGGDQVWHLDSAGIVGVAEADERFGQVLTTGDFNCDGRDDLAVGIPLESLSANEGGVVSVLYGSVGGLTSVNDSWYQSGSGVSESFEAYDRFGAALAVGDFDGDTCEDLVIGAPDEDYMTVVDAGWVYVMYGTVTGLETTGQFNFFQSTFGFVEASETNDSLGERFWIEDRDEDGYDDLTAYVPGEPSCAVAGESGFHVVYGGSTGLTATDDGAECLEAYQMHQ